MIAGLLIGAGLMFAIGLAAVLTDKAMRRDLADILSVLLGFPAGLVIELLGVLGRNRGWRARPIDPDTFRRIANGADLHGFRVAREGRYLIVLTKVTPSTAPKPVRMATLRPEDES